MDTDSGTWHHGLVARWWAEFTTPEPEEVAYYSTAIQTWGEPALDLGCGTGRILLPLLAAGLDVDGTDVSADMIAEARRAAEAGGYNPTLTVQAGHELDVPRAYRTIYLCGVFGIGGRRDRDLETLRRAHRHLEPNGALLLNYELPYEGLDAERWARWLPGGRAGIPRPWPDSGERKRMANGDELEWLNRVADMDPLAQRQTFQVRIRLWRDGQVVAEEEHQLSENLYFAPEIQHFLADAGFRDVAVEGGYRGQPATPDDGVLMFVARP